MSPEMISAIQTIGFPIVAVIAVAGFLGFIVKWLMGRFEKLYEDHRTDLNSLFADAKEMSLKFNETVRSVAEKHEKSNRDRLKDDMKYRNKVLQNLNNLHKDHKEISKFLKNLNGKSK